jgi:hypothetical protein
MTMAAQGENVDHIDTAYEALAQMETIKTRLGERTIALNMATKGDKAKKRSMLAQGESEIQDNIKTITDNRSQSRPSDSKGHHAILAATTKERPTNS